VPERYGDGDCAARPPDRYELFDEAAEGDAGDAAVAATGDSGCANGIVLPERCADVVGASNEKASPDESSGSGAAAAAGT